MPHPISACMTFWNYTPIVMHTYYVNKLCQNVGFETGTWRQIVTSQRANTKSKWPPYATDRNPPMKIFCVRHCAWQECFVHRMLSLIWSRAIKFTSCNLFSILYDVHSPVTRNSCLCFMFHFTIHMLLILSGKEMTSWNLPNTVISITFRRLKTVKPQ